jgi:Tol biopolymer transport system component/DNA-binding winged helix-turn-helix (wHTH) protein
MNQEHSGCYIFGDFRLDEAERRLLRNGNAVSLPPKVFDTLLLLVRNAGHLVEKDEFMKQLWPGTFVGEDALARNISILRKALGESSESQSFIATVPTRGYRFASPVQVLGPTQAQADEESPRNPTGRPALLEESHGSRFEDAPVLEVPVVSLPSKGLSASGREGRSVWSQRIRFVLLGLIVGSVAGVISFYLLLPAPVAKVIRTEQITHSGRVDPWARVVSDGSRIYYLERQGDHWDLMETSVSGGDSRKIDGPFRNTTVFDVSPDRSQLLIGSFERRGTAMPLWIWPVQGGTLKRVGQVETTSAVWTPDGRHIVYAENDGISLVDVDGTDVRRFVRTEGMPAGLSWSPDGQVLRFSQRSSRPMARAVWEVRLDGSQLRPILPDWSNFASEGAGSWSPNGRYYVFNTDPPNDLWLLREHAAFLTARREQPIHMVIGPMTFWGPVFGKNGNKLFVIGISGGGELVRYDLKLHQAIPLLPGVCSISAVFSPDGTQLACPSRSERSLLRMRPDGSDRLAFTLMPPFLGNFAWSPDGKQIVFDGATQDWKQRLFLVSAAGGVPKELFPDTQTQFDPAWSPDGKLLAFARTLDSVGSGSAGPGEAQSNIQVLDLSSNHLSVLPGSSGIRSPAWSPDGHFIAGVTLDGRKMMLFDLRTQQWEQLCEANLIFGRPYWSKDNESVYFQDILGEGESVYRFRLGLRKKELLVSFEELLSSGIQRVAFNGFTPDGALIASVDRNVADVYSVELDLP